MRPQEEISTYAAQRRVVRDLTMRALGRQHVGMSEPKDHNSDHEPEHLWPTRRASVRLEKALEDQRDAVVRRQLASEAIWDLYRSMRAERRLKAQ